MIDPSPESIAFHIHPSPFITIHDTRDSCHANRPPRQSAVSPAQMLNDSAGQGGITVPGEIPAVRGGVGERSTAP